MEQPHEPLRAVPPLAEAVPHPASVAEAPPHPASVAAAPPHPASVEISPAADSFKGQTSTLGGERGVRLLHSWEEARQRAFDCAQPLPAHAVPLQRATGRILARDIVALQDMPHYPSSAMDGWALAGSPPWILAEPGQRLVSGQASPIVTGALIPPGTKSVLRSESGQISTDDEGLPVLVLSGQAKPGEPKGGQHIRKAGGEALAGDLLVQSGAVLNPAQIALAALAGLDELQVLGQPAVSLVFTGDEVVSSGLPEPGQVRDTFSPQLDSVVRMLGGSVVGQQRAGDSLAAMVHALEDSEDDPADVIITTGATGRSSVDFLRPAIAELGGTLIVDGVAMRPGHPSLLAEFPDGRFLVGLPGNPLAAFMGLLTLGAPLLARLGSRPQPATLEVACGSPIQPSPGRTRLVPYRLVYGLASPAKYTDSGMLRGLASADGVVLVPPHGAKMGEALPAIPLPW